MGACFEVYREKGCGFVEPVYQKCLEKELGLQQIYFLAQPKLEPSHKKRIFKQNYEPDFLCYGL